MSDDELFAALGHYGPTVQQEEKASTVSCGCGWESPYRYRSLRAAVQSAIHHRESTVLRFRREAARAGLSIQEALLRHFRDRGFGQL